MVHAVTSRAILAPARSMLAFLAREWGRLTTSDLGQRLQRDPSMVSRLAGAYAAHRDAAGEAQVCRVLSLNSTNKSISSMNLYLIPGVH